MTGAWRVALIIALMACFRQVTAEPDLGLESKCKCRESSECRKAETKPPETEIIVITNGKSQDMGAWSWDAITTVISEYQPPSETNTAAACMAHKMGKHFGFIVRPPDVDDFNYNDSTIANWLNTVEAQQQQFYADHLVIDLIKALVDGADSKFNGSAFANLTNLMDKILQLKPAITNNGLYCLVPWQPCPKENCDDSVKKVLSYCTLLILSPDSYIPDKDLECQAQATIPFGKFIYGIDQYIMLNSTLDPKRTIIAGIPWHGLDYECDTLLPNNNVCSIDKNNSVCNMKGKSKRKSLGEIHDDSSLVSKTAVNELAKAVFVNYKNDTTNKQHQIWFENIETLSIKYRMVFDLGIRGYAIWTAEDLSYGLSVNKISFSSKMWNWLTHDLIHSSASTPVKSNHYYADTVAGVGVGCLLLGTLLGITFTCIALRRKSGQTSRPFKLDEETDEFHDDPGL